MLASVGWSVEILRSSRRKKTISARLSDSRLQIRLPAELSAGDEVAWVRRICKRMIKTNRADPNTADRWLLDRARRLDAEYLAGHARPLQARFALRLTSSFANVNPRKRVIQVSARLRRAPEWVIDYLLLHEMVHLLVSGHSSEFHELVDRYRYAERAKGYLVCMSQLED